MGSNTDNKKGVIAGGVFANFIKVITLLHRWGKCGENPDIKNP
jgi:hypothetical protein